MSMRDAVRALLREQGPLTLDKIVEGTDIEPRKIETMLWQMTNEGHLKKTGEGFATLYALGREKIRPAGRPAAKAQFACMQAIEPNVPKFLPAMSVDGRLIILGGDAPLVLSVEQTEQLAGLLAQHFDVA